MWSPQCSSATKMTARRVIFPSIHAKQTRYDTMTVSDASEISPKNSKSGLVKASSIESDMPSIASLSTCSEKSSVSWDSMCRKNGPVQTGQEMKSRRVVKFDPRIWVHEFIRSKSEAESTWFTTKDLNTFKENAIHCIVAYNRKVDDLAKQSNSTYRRQHTNRVGNALFSHPALGVDSEYDCLPFPNVREVKESNNTVSSLPMNQFREAIAENEIRNVLIVDSSDVCLKLYGKGIKLMFPNARISTAKTSKDALTQMNHEQSKLKLGGSFDVIIVDEKLMQSTLQKSSAHIFVENEKDISNTVCPYYKTLVVGVCSHLKIDTGKLVSNGADLVWSKPPPKMNYDLRDELVKTLLIKRGRSKIASKVF